MKLIEKINLTASNKPHFEAHKINELITIINKQQEKINKLEKELSKLSWEVRKDPIYYD